MAAASELLCNFNDPNWASDPVIAMYKSVLSQYCAPQPCNPVDATYASGLGGAWLVVRILKNLGSLGLPESGRIPARVRTSKTIRPAALTYGR
jgi:hypothetical protein